MIISVSGRKLLEINMLQVTQLCGTNIGDKYYILQSLKKYFSTSKYAEYEEDYRENIKVDNGVVGRKYFQVFSVSNRDELISAIKITKNSLLFKYLSATCSDFELMTLSHEVESRIDLFMDKMNSMIEEELGDISIEYKMDNIFSLLQTTEVKGVNGEYLETLSNYELLEILLKLLSQIQGRDPQKVLLLFENIDHLITREEYSDVFSICISVSETSDTWFVLSTSLPGYVVLNEEYIEGVNIVNDFVIQIPDAEHLLMYVRDNYPVNEEIEKSRLFASMKEIIHTIGEQSIKNPKDDVFKKIIDKAFCVNSYWKNSINAEEVAFLKDKSMI